MLKIDNDWEVAGWKHALRGMRNAKNSWDKSDSGECEGYCIDCPMEVGEDPHTCPAHCNNRIDYVIGPNDRKLATTLRNAGTDHRKYMRMIVVWMDITAPLYWWKEFDTYKVGTVANSCSTMHKIHDKEFTLEDFSTEHLIDWEGWPDDDGDLMYYCEDCGTRISAAGMLRETTEALNFYRNKFLEAKTKPMKDNTKRAELMKKYWWQMIQLLPSSYNQRRTVKLNYEVLANIYHSRRNHKLDEWHTFCDWIESLPYSELITGKKVEKVEE
jgi:hypothetical protein